MALQAGNGSPTTQDGEGILTALPGRKSFGVCQFSAEMGPDGQIRRLVQRLGLDELGREWDAESWHSTAFSRQCSSEFSRQNSPGIPDDASAAAMREFLQAGAKRHEAMQEFSGHLAKGYLFAEKEPVSPTACTSVGEEMRESASDGADTVRSTWQVQSDI
eukprot:TRINITY_DN42471_c0_g1_i1.p1 TRINITY_DN42471_c0_g1~~TRINITY_DN42471_c0_g1_i1.p1  ORF type:complete len:161 (-),score=33.37 TRINITY_DN42471_c0_g1_i1:6-488(-)